MSEADKWEEVARFKEAADRLVRRAQEDPEVARGFLRDIGYYAIMGLPDPGIGAAAEPPAAERERSGRAGAARKTVHARRKRAAAGR